MIEKIIDYIDSLNDFLNSEGLCFLKENDQDILLPCKANGNEYKFIHNFDKLKEFSYWRVIAPVDLIRVDNYSSIKKIYQLTYPCKLMLIKNGIHHDNMALNIISKLTSMKKINRNELGVNELDINFINFDTTNETVVRNEFGENFKIYNGFSYCSFNVNIIVTIDQNCLDKC